MADDEAGKARSVEGPPGREDHIAQESDKIDDSQVEHISEVQG